MSEVVAWMAPNPGWECPKCGSVYAPWVYSCSRHSSGNTYTYTTTNPGDTPYRYPNVSNVS